jgi:subfamily B ATP-binding cassette protein MsbA
VQVVLADRLNKLLIHSCISDPKDPKANMSAQISLLQRLKRITPYFSGHSSAVVAAVLATLIGAATEPAIPALMRLLLDKGFQQGNVQLWMVPVALLSLFGIRGATSFIASYALAHVTNHGMRQLRGLLFDKLLHAHQSLFRNQSASALTNTVVYEVQNGAATIVATLLSLSRDALTLVALLGYLLYLNWKLTLIVLVMFPSLAWVMKVLSRRLDKISKASQKATDELAYVVEENVLAQRMVRLHNAQEAQASRFEKFNDELRRLAMKSVVAGSAMTPLTQMLAAVALSAVICIALWQNASSGATVGGFAAFVTAMLMLIAPIKHLSEVAGPLTRGVSAIERGLDLIENTFNEVGGSQSIDKVQGCIQLKSVTVRYPDSQHPALDSIDLTIESGTTVALVGRSGSGKTTLANLLPRFIDWTSGQITLDGIPLEQWRLDALRRQFSIVSQDVVMFNDTIAANVALGAEIDRQRVREALVAANLDSHINALPQGIDTLVGHNATQLSGGQRQRLAIARAIYKDAPILILDEATSALDTESEQAVKGALARLMVGRTTLVIAHRMSTIEHADRIVVMDQGSIVESGTHQELLANQSSYARLHSITSTASSNNEIENPL